MALFFDQAWFDAKLGERGLSKTTLATLLGIGISGIEAMWKDQREISAREVMFLAEILGVSAEEIAERGGAATPLPKTALSVHQLLARLELLEARIQRLETDYAALAARC